MSVASTGVAKYDEMLREGYESYRTYVNPLIALRAELLSEPTRVTAARDGQLVEPRGNVEDFHGTQSFGHRHPHVAKAITDFLATDSPNWFPCRINPYAGLLAEQLCERANATPCGFYDSGSVQVERAKDGIHPTPKGGSDWAEAVFAAIVE